ncbi:putative gustatory receptor 28b [Schistocerca cancellata]|uniref:putative gustatory receptor 28b n=1 Tax=Schistocerca cancellata TaxID=274614 RepID=UPI002117E0B0|nr:putative gustatory receptor 28b [Schistocerca cancellata]
MALLLTYGICVTSDMNDLRGFNECLKFADERLAKCETAKLKVLGGFIFSIYFGLLVILVVIYVLVLGRQLMLLSCLVYLVLVLTMTLQQVMLVLELWVRFCSLNANLLEVLSFPGDSWLCFLLGGTWLPTTPPRPPLPVIDSSLCQLQDAHVALTRAADMLQQHFGLPTTASTAASVCGATCSAYELLMALVNPDWIEQYSLFQSAGVSALWLAYHLIKLVSLALSSAKAIDAAAATGVILLRASTVSTCSSPQNEAFLRLTMMGPPLRFTAAGFITVDRRLLVSATAIVITYVIILGQFTVTQ